ELLDRETEAQFLVELRVNSKLLVNRLEGFELFEGIGFRPQATQAEVGTEWVKWLGVTAAYIWGTAVNHDPVDGLQPSLERGCAAAEVGDRRPLHLPRAPRHGPVPRLHRPVREPAVPPRHAARARSQQVAGHVRGPAVLREGELSAALLTEGHMTLAIASDLM